jgi:hypothetical protein
MTPDPSDRNSSVSHFGPKHILFGVLGLLTLFVIYSNERFIVDHSDPLWAYYLPVHWLLVPHCLAGAICLCLGATQFSTRLRQRHARVHRALGRCYVIGVVVAATISLSIAMLRNELPLQIAVFPTLIDERMLLSVAGSYSAAVRLKLVGVGRVANRAGRIVEFIVVTNQCTPR